MNIGLGSPLTLPAIAMALCCMALSFRSELAEAEPATVAKTQVDNTLVDKELLEFLADFDEVDDDEFELLVHYAVKDSEKVTNGESEQQNTSQEERDE